MTFDALTTAAIVLVGIWLFGMVMRIGGTLIHLALLAAIAAAAAKYFNLIQF
jgi:hypothetical protein